MEFYSIKNPLGSLLFLAKSINLPSTKDRKKNIMKWIQDQSLGYSVEQQERVYLEYQNRFDLDIPLLSEIFPKLGWAIYIVIPLLEEKKTILEKHGLINKKNGKKFYELTDLGLFLFNEKKYKEYIKSLTFKADFWKKNNVKITDNTNIGSGTFINKHTIITCKHVIDELNKNDLLIEDEDGKKYNVKKYIRHQDENIDLLKIITEEEFNFFHHSISTETRITEKVLVFGYPPIPLSSKPFLVANLGEISSIVDNYLDGTDCLILSCITRPGNSGGPIINEFGKLIGIVTQNRQHKFSPIFQDMENLDINKSIAYGTGISAKHILEFS